MLSFKEFLLELSVKHATDFATKAHAGQIRKSSGEPYVMHPTAVYSFLRTLGVKDRNVLVSAMLHDTIEDSPATHNKLKSEFNKDVARIVSGLSSSKKGIKALGKPAYLAQKMMKMDSEVLTIKLADRWHNLQDMGDMPATKSKKYMDQTEYIIQELRAKKQLNKTQKKIIKKIEQTMKKFGHIPVVID